jgi:hypothetical protein
MNKMTFTLSSDRSLVHQLIGQAPNGYVVEIRKPSRSLEQNALYWSTVHEIAEQVSVDGQKYTPQVWHKYFKERYLPGRILELPYGHIVEAEASTSGLTKEQFSHFVEQVIQFKLENT